MQDTVLFEGTVRDNIAFGRSGATGDQIVEAAKLASADEFITRMPHRWCWLPGSETGESLEWMTGFRSRRAVS